MPRDGSGRAAPQSAIPLKTERSFFNLQSHRREPVPVEQDEIELKTPRRVSTDTAAYQPPLRRFLAKPTHPSKLSTRISRDDIPEKTVESRQETTSSTVAHADYLPKRPVRTSTAPTGAARELGTHPAAPRNLSRMTPQYPVDTSRIPRQKVATNIEASARNSSRDQKRISPSKNVDQTVRGATSRMRKLHVDTHTNLPHSQSVPNVHVLPKAPKPPSLDPQALPELPKPPALSGVAFDMPPPLPATAESVFGNRDRSPSPRSLSAATRRLWSALRGASKLGSRPGSESASRGTSRAASRSSERSVATVVSTDQVPDNWVEHVPRRKPLPSVQSALHKLLKSDGPLVDTNSNEVRRRMDLRDMDPNEMSEAKHFLGRGIYIAGSADDAFRVFSDEDGNFLWRPGDHIAFRYSIKGALGKGSFGTVLKCRDHKTGRMVAVKVIAKKSELRAQAQIETGLMRDLVLAGSPDASHFVRLIDSVAFRHHLCIISEMLGPSLYDLLKRNRYRGLELSSVRYITRQLCEGLEFLDKQNIIHCDLKPENVLVSDIENCQVKIIDFGSGCYADRRIYTYIQSRFYRAPEILMGMQYGTAIDIWSLGCLVPELLMGRPIFPSENEADQVALICEYLGTPSREVLRRCTRATSFFDPYCRLLKYQNPSGKIRRAPGSKSFNDILPPAAAEFCTDCLKWDPADRLSPKDAAFHNFVLGV